MSDRPLMMIPGPIEISRQVVAAAAKHPSSHVSKSLIESMGRIIENMRIVWMAAHNSQPFVVAGSGTTAMDMAVHNMIDPQDSVLVLNSGYFSDRIAEMLKRRGAAVKEIEAASGEAGRFGTPDLAVVDAALSAGSFKVMVATHVDTSTGVRVNAEAICKLAKKYKVRTIFDGVCATAAERFEMGAWGADVYLTASQKAIGLPPGLALIVVSEKAMATRKALTVAPPLSFDWLEWQPIMNAYENRRPSYFSTPATSLVAALDVSLHNMVGETDTIEASFDRHARSAAAMRSAWQCLNLELLPIDEDVAANTLSAIKYPPGIDAALLGEIGKRGVVVAGGLHPKCKASYFRVGHMGDVLQRPRDLIRTIQAIGESLVALGHDADVKGAMAAATEVLAS